MLFIVKSLYEVVVDPGAGCGDKILTLDECREALSSLGYNHKVTVATYNDMQKGCSVGDTDNDGFSTTSYFNTNPTPSGPMHPLAYRSVCFAGM